MEKIPHGWFRKVRLETAEDLKKIGIRKWRTIVHNKKEWRIISMAAETLKE
jgi:hypothetical protein